MASTGRIVDHRIFGITEGERKTGTVVEGPGEELNHARFLFCD